jgi:rubrerythrin
MSENFGRKLGEAAAVAAGVYVATEAAKGLCNALRKPVTNFFFEKDRYTCGTCGSKFEITHGEIPDQCPCCGVRY